MPIGLGGLGHLAAPLIDERLVGPGFCHITVKRNGVVEIREGVFVVIECDVRKAAAVIGLRRCRRQRDRLGEVFDGLGMLVAQLVDQATICLLYTSDAADE